jgi:hypothetical protein
MAPVSGSGAGLTMCFGRAKGDTVSETGFNVTFITNQTDTEILHDVPIQLTI